MSELQKIEPQRPQLIRPIVKANEMIEAHKEVSVLIRDALEDGKDYGKIPGTQKNTLLKPGAERLLKAFGCTSKFTLIDKETDYVKENSWKDKYGREKTSQGYYRYVYKCEVISGDGRVIGDSDGSCSTLETKYITRPHDSENTVVKMAQKRALVGGVLNAFGLSDRFTQDTEEFIDVNAEQIPRDNIYRQTNQDKKELASFCTGVGIKEPTMMKKFSEFCDGKEKDFKSLWIEYSGIPAEKSIIVKDEKWDEIRL